MRNNGFLPTRSLRDSAKPQEELSNMLSAVPTTVMITEFRSARRTRFCLMISSYP